MQTQKFTHAPQPQQKVWLRCKFKNLRQNHYEVWLACKLNSLYVHHNVYLYLSWRFFLSKEIHLARKFQCVWVCLWLTVYDYQSKKHMPIRVCKVRWSVWPFGQKLFHNTLSLLCLLRGVTFHHCSLNDTHRADKFSLQLVRYDLQLRGFAFFPFLYSCSEFVILLNVRSVT